MRSFFFFFNDTATTEIYTLSLHDALPISQTHPHQACTCSIDIRTTFEVIDGIAKRYFKVVAKGDRKSTRLNSSHVRISYAVFCLKKKKAQTSSPRDTRSAISVNTVSRVAG